MVTTSHQNTDNFQYFNSLKAECRAFQCRL